MSPIVEVISNWLQLIILCSTVITLMVTLGKTAQKPNQVQDDRLASLEKWRDAVEQRLENASSHFDKLDEGNRVTQKALLAILGHDISGNNEAELKDAQRELNDYLVKQK